MLNIRLFVKYQSILMFYKIVRTRWLLSEINVNLSSFTRQVLNSSSLNWPDLKVLKVIKFNQFLQYVYLDFLLAVSSSSSLPYSLPI